jgi:hypothetical protein
MASQKVRVVVEFPAGMRKLNKQQADRLKNLFRTELANNLGAAAADRLAVMDFENVTSPPGGGKLAAKKAASKKGVKGAAKKSSKKG